MRRLSSRSILALFAFFLLSFGATAQTTYQYDARGRLKEVTYDNGEVVSYTYDAAGNRTAESTAGAPPHFSIADASANEGSTVDFLVTRGGDTSVATSVDYATSVGTAGASDFTAASGTLSFAATEVSKTVSVTTAQEAIYETDETFTLTLSNPAGSAQIVDGEAVGTINNDDSGPSFSINSPASVDESNDVVFTVTKTGASEITHGVSYTTADATAVSGSDYTSAVGSLTFSPSDATKTITVSTLGDSSFEATETFTVTISSPTNNASIGTATGTGTITDDDTAPSFSVSDASATEGGTAVFTVSLSGPSPVAHDIDYATSTGTAGAGDFTAVSNTLSFAIGETSKTVNVSTTGDSAYEGNETFSLTLASPTGGAALSDATGVGTINEDDAPPSFAINDVSITEGGTLSFTVTKTGATNLSHNLSYATANGTAGGADYTTASGSLTFASGETSKTINVSTTGDATYESNETVLVNLSSATNGATISDSQGVGTINDNDTAPSFSINDVSVSEGGILYFTVTKSGSTELTHNVNYATANGTAGSADYTAASGTLSFTSGEATKTVAVQTTEEIIFEPNETMYVNLSSATSGATIPDSQGVGTINNDDLELVRDQYGSLQPGYTQSSVYNWKLGYINRTKVGSTTIYTVLSPIEDYYCDTSVTPISGYSWTGNGCEMRVD